LSELAERVRINRLAPVLVAGLAFAVAAWASRPYAVGVFHDDGVYAVLAKALATGQGYRYLHLPGAPAAVHYPPGYPLLLAVLWRIWPAFPSNIPVLLLANTFFLAVTAWCVHRIATRVLGWSNAVAAMGAIVAALAYPLLMLSGLVLSEPLFVALLFPVLIYSERVAADEASTRQAILAGMFAGALALVRTHGAAVAIALLFVLALRRRWRTALFVASGALVVVAPWQVWASAHGAGLADSLRGSYGSYGAWLVEGARGGGLAFVGRTIIVNLRETRELLADRFAITDSQFIRAATGSAMALFVFAGAWRAWRRAQVTVLFTAVYFVVLLLWPYTPWRFFFALWPVLVLFVGEVVQGIWANAPKLNAVGRPLALAVIALVAVGLAREESRAYSHRAWNAPADAATAQIAPVIRWISSSTNRDDVVAAEGEQLVYLFTGRRALPVARFTASEYLRAPTTAEGAAALGQILSDFPVRYVLTISPPVLASADLLGQSGAPRLVRVGQLPGGGVFRVDRP
jgi:hypothetical protein